MARGVGVPLAGRVGVVTLSSGGAPTLVSGEGPDVADDVPDWPWRYSRIFYNFSNTLKNNRKIKPWKKKTITDQSICK